MKKFLCLLMLLSLLINLSACRSSNTGADNNLADPTEHTSASEPSQNSRPGTGTDRPQLKPIDPMPEGTAVNVGVQYIRTNGYHGGAVFPRVVIIRSFDELRQYYLANRNTFDLERHQNVYADTTIGFLDACDRYDPDYFANKILIMVLLEECSGSIRHEVTGVYRVKNGQLNVVIDAVIPEICTADMAQWHILIELDRTNDLSSENVLLNGKSWISGSSHPAS